MEGHAHAADNQGAGQWLKLGMKREGLVFVPDKIKDTDVKDRDQAGHNGHDGVQRQLDKGVDQMIGGER